MIRFPVTRLGSPVRALRGLFPLAVIALLATQAAPYLSGASVPGGGQSTALLIGVGLLAAWGLLRAAFRLTFGLLGLMFWAGILGALVWFVYRPGSIGSTGAPVSSVISSVGEEQVASRSRKALRGSPALPESAYFPPQRGSGKFGSSLSSNLPAELRRLVRGH
jgi:hypothetical protein